MKWLELGKAIAAMDEELLQQCATVSVQGDEPTEIYRFVIAYESEITPEGSQLNRIPTIEV
jgi:hypothetical protein